MNQKITKKIIVVLICFLILSTMITGCVSPDAVADKELGNGWEKEYSMELSYAENFNVDYYTGGYALITISDGSRFLVVPEDQQVPTGIDDDIVILQQPIDNIYLVATSVMCLFDSLDSLDTIALSGTDADGWYIENAKKALENGDILYAGKYSKPDYELLLAHDCKLAIENTMISHTPEVKEKIEALGIPVIIEQSSFEPHPLGRTEWIKLYAVLVDKEDIAERIFDEQVAYMRSVEELEDTDKTVAFFYISSSGSAVTRKSGDYVTKMIELAGGEYIYNDLGDPEKATSTVTLEMEEFYTTAKDADYIIYNSTIDGGIYTIEELVGKNALLADFKAVQNGDVWCTGQNLYQETTQLGLMISDIHRILVSGDELTELNFLYKLE